jgi:MFS transporter, DHA2 family, multidrug resistance protein
LAPEAHQQALSWIGQEVQTQASYLAYIDVFWVLTALSVAAIPLALSLRKIKLGGHAPSAH